MSMNIYITARRKISFKRKDGTQGSDIQKVKFNAWQTTTKVTYEIMESEDRKQAYIDWVSTRSFIEEVKVYADDDILCEKDPIGIEVYNAGKDHIHEFKQWCDKMEEDGFLINYEAM